MIWDFPTRTFHWLLVISIAGAYFTGEEAMWDWHPYFGVSALALVVFRVVWGFAGPSASRFSAFVSNFAGLIAYGKAFRESLRTKQHADYTSHNPWGGVAVVAMLTVTGAQSLTGMFASEEFGLLDGPFFYYIPEALSDGLTLAHNLIIDTLIILIALHISAIALHRFRFGEKLTTRMITGRDANAAVTPEGIVPTARRSVLGFSGLVVCLALGWLVIWI